MRYLIAVFGLALALPHPAAAQAFDWRPVNQQTVSMIHAGQFDAALPLIEAGLADCPNAVTPLEVGLCTAIFSENLGIVREHQGDLPAAEAALRKTLESRSSVLPPADPMIGEAHLFLALFFERHGRREDETASLQAAEAIARAGGPTHRSELATLITRHAMALAALGRPVDALKLYQEAYAIAVDVGGPTSRDALATLGNLFSGQIGAGVPDAAIDAVSGVLASPDVASFDPTQRAMLAGKLATETATTAQSKAALAFAEAALPDLDNGLVTDPDASFNLLRGAAKLNAALGDAGRAVDLARRARALAAGKWGPASYAATSALRVEADAEAARHDFPAAIARLTEAAGMLDGPKSGLTRVQIAIELGNMRWRVGRKDAAITDYLALTDSPALSDSEPATRAAMLALLGEALVRMEALEPGAKACGQATELATQQPTLASYYVVKALLCSGGAALALGRPADALDAANRAQTALWANIAAPAEPSRISQLAVVDLRARALRDSNRNNEALAAYRDELALARKSGDIASQGATWSQIAYVQGQLGLYKDADDSGVAGLALLGPDGALRPRANLLNTRALAAVAFGRAADAVPFFESSLALRRKEAVIEPLAIASGERDLAVALSALGRNAEAGRHMDVAIDGYRALGESRHPFLVVALDRRVSIATAAGDPNRAESALRELLPLQDRTSDDAAGARILLAGLLDNQARQDEADILRTQALSIVTGRHGANSVEAVRVRLAALASLRESGRLVEAEAAGRACASQAAAMHDVLLSCLMAQAETALTAGTNRIALEISARAVQEAETHWTQNGGILVQALTLQARSEAALGDADAVLRVYDRIHGLTPGQGINRGWTDFSEGRLLMQAGENSIGQAMLRLALEQANHLHDAGLAVAATEAFAEQLVEAGRGPQAIQLWQAVLPLLSEDAPVYRVTVLEGMGTASAEMGKSQDAARFFGEAVSLSRTEMGAGSLTYDRLVLAWAAALMRSGEPAKSDEALRLLANDTKPVAQRLWTIGQMRLASMTNDPVAAVLLARSVMEQARAAFGPASVGAAFARVDLIEALVETHKHVDAADLNDALAIIQAQDPDWHIAYLAARLRGSLAVHTGRLNDATILFMRAELLATAHEGVGSLAAATQRANRASVQLLTGHAGEADTLYRQALEMAAPDGDWRNTVWAGIAGDAAVAAERVGDIERAIHLRSDAGGLMPPVTVRESIRWI
jgi:tetratricopeptide (TPR) repeat protein